MSVAYLTDGKNRSLRTFITEMARDLDNKKIINAAICYESTDRGVDYFVSEQSESDKIGTIGLLTFMAIALGVNLFSEHEDV